MSMMDCPIWANDETGEYNVGEPNWNPEAYRCHLAILREEDGTFSSIVLNLPGAGSCGDSEEEVVANVRDAVAEVVGSYKEIGADVPWEATYAIPEGVKTKWILVNA